MSLKLLGKNTAIYAFGNVGMRAAAFLVIPLYTHKLSINAYGFLATLQLTMQMMMIFVDSGMRSGLVRFTKEFKENNMYGNLLGTSSLINILAGVMATSILLGFFTDFFRNVLHLYNVSLYICLVCGAAVAQSLAIHLMSYYRAEDKALQFMVTGISSSLFLILANGVFLYGFNLGVKGALWASLATYLILLVLLSWDIFSKTGIGISWSLIPSLLHFGFPLVFSNFALLIMGGASIYFLSYYLGLESVAIFSLGSKLASVLVMALILPFQLAVEPFVFTNLSRANIKGIISKMMTYLFLAIIFMFFIILFGSRILLPLIAPPAYSPAFLIILFLLPGTAFIGIYYIGQTLLGAVKKNHILGFIMTIFVIISILLNYLLIPMMGLYGAVVVTNLSYIFAGVTIFDLGKKYFPFTIEWKRISICGGIIVFFFLLFFLLAKANLLIFTALSLLACLGSIVILFRLQFFSSEEKTLLKELLQKRTTNET